MALKPDLRVGTVSTTSGTKDFTVAGGLDMAAYGVRAGDSFIINGLMLIIESIDYANDEGQLVEECPAAAAVTNKAALIRYHQDGSSLSAKVRELLEILGGGVFFQYRASGNTADRDLYDSQAKGFTFLDTSTEPMGLYIKASDTIADWAGPSAYMHGNNGWAPDLRVEFDGARVVLKLHDWIGGDGPKPVNTGYFSPGGLTGNIALAYNIRPPAGAGTGDMLQAMYDPQNIMDDAFDRANHTGNIPVGNVAGLSPVASTGSFHDLLDTPRFDFSMFIAGRPLSGELVGRYSFLETVVFPAAATGSRASSSTAATSAGKVFSLRKNGTQFGTVTFSTSSTGVFAIGADTTFDPGDILTVIAPSPQDGTLADISIALAGDY